MTAQTPISGWLTPEDHARAKALMPNAHTIAQIGREVAEATGIPVERILSASRRDRPATRARWLVWSIASRAGMSLAAIGRATGHHHTSVADGIRQDAAERQAPITDQQKRWASY